MRPSVPDGNDVVVAGDSPDYHQILPDGVALPDVTTAANGSFSFTDTPPDANVDTATVTYKVSYAG